MQTICKHSVGIYSWPVETENFSQFNEKTENGEFHILFEMQLMCSSHQGYFMADCSSWLSRYSHSLTEGVSSVYGV